MPEKTEAQRANLARSIVKRKGGITSTTKTYDLLMEEMRNGSAFPLLEEGEYLISLSLFENNRWFCLTTRRMLWQADDKTEIYLSEIETLLGEVCSFPPIGDEDSPQGKSWSRFTLPMTRADLLPEELGGTSIVKVPLKYIRMVLSDNVLLRIPFDFGDSLMGIHSSLEYLLYRDLPSA